MWVSRPGWRPTLPYVPDGRRGCDSPRTGRQAYTREVMSRVLPIATMALALIVTAPAAAITGWGISGKLHSGAVTTAAAKTGTRQSTCQAGKREKTPKALKLTGTARNPAVVACEQPPRSDLVTPALKSSPASALATVG